MLKALWKKQLLETAAMFTTNRKNGKRRTGKALVGYGILYGVLLLYLAGVFGLMSYGLCEPLAEAGMGWLYFTLMSMIALMLGVFGSVFNTYAALYHAKDNEALLSMPIKPSYILLVRVAGVWFWGQVYSGLVMLPAAIIWCIFSGTGVLGCVLAVLGVLVMSLPVLVLSCLLGWVVALISTRLRNKSIITVLLSLVFFAGYYYICGNSFEMLQKVLLYTQELGEAFSKWLYPFYLLGRGAEGHVGSFLGAVGIFAALVGVTWLALDRSFIHITTMNRGEKKTVYREKKVKQASVISALIRKELRRFTGNANYMLNCGLGLVMLPLLSVLLIVKRDLFSTTLFSIVASVPMISNYLPVIAAAVLMLASSVIDISAPSVSLEGKHIWVLQTLPVPAWQALKAKILMHLMLSVPVLLIACGTVVWALSLGLLESALLVLILMAFAALQAQGGLALNLKAPNLKWTSESQPIKQSLAVNVCVLGGFAVSILLGGGYYFLYESLGAVTYLGMCLAVLVVADALIYRWIRTRGTRIFETL